MFSPTDKPNVAWLQFMLGSLLSFHNQTGTTKVGRRLQNDFKKGKQK